MYSSVLNANTNQINFNTNVNVYLRYTKISFFFSSFTSDYGLS